MKLKLLMLLLVVCVLAGCHINTYVDKRVSIHTPNNRGTVTITSDVANTSDTNAEGSASDIGKPTVDLTP